MSQPPTPVDVSSIPARKPNDNRRLGLVQVHPKTTDNEEVSKKKVDIIFMHGLDAQSPKTWVAWVRDDDPRSGNVNWLSDEHMLPAAMSDARILTYDWNSNYDRTASRERLVGHADALLERISRDREDFNRHGTPLMFVASCYSGLLLAQALVRATEIYLPRYKINRKILDCVAGVAFLGTPFGGSWKTGNLVASLRVRNAVNGAKEYNRELIEYLRPGTRDAPSPLEDLVQRFTYMIRHEDFKFGIVCFYETRDTDFSPYKSKLPQSDGSQLDENGHGIVVDQNSACLQGVDRIGLDVRHNMLHKYNSPQNEGFKHLTSRLREFQRRAELKQSKRAKLHDKCLEALYFDGINYEPGQIREASEASCQWLLEHPIYSNWHKKGRGVFWILGNPGSGKSTIMKHAVKKDQRLHGDNSTLILSFFFHNQGHRLQHTVEGLLRGLLRQLLEKAPGHMHNLYNKLDIVAPKGLHDSRWVASTLVKLLEEALAAVLDHVNIRIFVDALDECRVGEEDDDTQEIEDLVQKLREIEELMRAKSESLSICFACRHDPPLASLNKDPYIKTEWENGGAIEEYVQQELLRITDDEQLRSDLQTEIVHSANGNFLWASLVTAEAIRLRRRGLPVEERIRNTPRQISTIYEEILCRLSRETPAMSLKVFQWLCFALQTFPLHAFRFACDVDAPGTDSLSLWERPDSLTYDDNPRLERLIRTLSGGLAEVDADGDVVLIHQSVKDFLIKDGFRILDPEQNTHQKVMASGHGLLLSSCLWWLARSDLPEVFQVLMDTFDPAIIGIVLNMKLNHGKFEPLFELCSKLKLNSEDCSRCLGDDMRSAVDGLSSSDRATLRGVLSGEVEICDFWSASYREGIVSKEFDNWHVADEIYACWCIKIILIALGPSFTVYLYARELWVCHALETANNGGSSTARSEIHKFCSQLEPQDATICNRILGMLHLAASYPESWVLEQLLVHVPSSSLDINSMCGGYGWTPIMTAIRLGNVENIRTLLAHEKADVNAKNLSDQTALFVAVVEGNYLLTELLINKGASLDIQCGKGYTALIYAVFRDEFEIMNLLLENGANVHLKIHEGWDAIDFAHGRCLDGLSRFLDRKIALRDKEI